MLYSYSYRYYGPVVKRVLVTKAGLVEASGHDKGSRTIGRGLSESRGLGLVRTGGLVRGNVNVLS